ncbi:L-lysine 6-monooxygenase (NADPH-requiring)-domain-containing protein [Clohesyomyces aquaticus]|uniref:L-ornithine N(5)-monooxygenase [NAD(P)H] n=1 Tax=Clohesyomyces aquaticus TaxID=1231657 RepID=A0A1Y1Y1S7_9PLEO|nr:L-lysine 6-monooxygenase (NADPH-requiring)-domain-containing protein [Clohesyomyces aquaticus]
MTFHEQAAKPRLPSPNTSTANATQLYDLVCIGFGPAQIAAAIANRESQQRSNVLFIERNSSFSWYPDGHVPRARMTSPFIYDLATMRNPRSKFTYSSYLLSRNRLVDFLNSDRLNPMREEFEDYLRWCADQFESQVRYQNEVIWVRPESKETPNKKWTVGVKDTNGRTYILETKNIMTPSPSPRNAKRVPLLTEVDFDAGQRIISTQDYMSKRESLRIANSPRLDIAVIGSSYKTIEILDDLLTCPRLGNITLITDDDSLAPLKALNDEDAPPSPKLCAIWARPSCDTKAVVPDSSELIQNIYKSAYEKQVASKGQYRLRVMLGISSAKPFPRSAVIISDIPTAPQLRSRLFHDLDSLVLGCRQKGECLEEVQFKRGAVASGCAVWMISANSDGGRSLAKDIAIRAGEVIQAMSAAKEKRRENASVALMNARM